MVKALPFIHQPDRMARKASDVSAADWRYQTRVKMSHFFTCIVMIKHYNHTEICSPEFFLVNRISLLICFQATSLNFHIL